MHRTLPKIGLGCGKFHCIPRYPALLFHRGVFPMINPADSGGSSLRRTQWHADGGIRLELLGSVDFPAGYRGTAHAHPFWELIFIRQGEGSFEGGTGSLSVVSGEILLVPPGTRHRFDASAKVNLDQFYLGFSADFARMPSTSMPRALTRGPFTDLIRVELEGCLSDLRDENAAESVHGRLVAVAGRVMRFLIPAPTPRGTRGRSDSPILLAREFLQSDLKGRHEVGDLAHRFCLSPQYFGEIFKRETGMSVKEFQRECRLERAMLLLREGNLTITDVAAEVGLEDIAYFSRLFKRKFGVPPRQARSRLQAEAIAA
jgi:AraC family transcriptional regulator of arabinose operon